MSYTYICLSAYIYPTKGHMEENMTAFFSSSSRSYVTAFASEKLALDNDKNGSESPLVVIKGTARRHYTA